MGIFNPSTTSSGSNGSVGINYFTNPNFEDGTVGGWTRFQTTALPTEGSSTVISASASANTSLAVDTTAPLRSTTSLLYTFGIGGAGTTPQFQGFISPVLTIDQQDYNQPKILNLSFDYLINNTTLYIEKMFRVFVYDVTAGTWSLPLNYDQTVRNLSESLQAVYIQTKAGSSQYRVAIMAVDGYAASIALMRIDNLYFGPQVKTLAPIISDSQAYTPVFTGIGTATSVQAFFLRRGSMLKVIGKGSAGTVPGGVKFKIGLPSGLQIDTTKLPSNSTTNLGTITRGAAASVQIPTSSRGPWPIIASPSDGVDGVYSSQTSDTTSGFTSQNGSDALASGDFFSFEFEVPISGWSANGVASIQDGQQLVSVKVNRITSGQNIAGATLTKLLFNNVVKDSVGGFNVGLSRFTASSPGDYLFSLGLSIVDTAATQGQGFVNLYKNGVNVQHAGIFNYAANGETSSTPVIKAENVIAGDYFEIYAYSSTAFGVYGNNSIVSGSYLSIEKLSLSSFIAPTEKTAPTVQKFTTGSGTYTKPNGVLYLKVKMVGGGGGGGSGGTTGNAGTSGGITTFGSSFLTANGGAGGNFAGAGGSGGSASIGSGATGAAFTGGSGSSGPGNLASGSFATGGPGAATSFGGNGAPSINAAGTAAIANTGSGGGGGSSTNGVAGVYSGGGGGAGGFVEANVPTPATTYSYAVGAAGAAGGVGANGYSGGNGGSGFILIEEYYQ